MRNLTQTPAANERPPAWSPDGRSVAYFSDESSEYQLDVRVQDGKGAVKKFRLPDVATDAVKKSPPSRSR